jgi:hypothetical protein
MKNIEKNNKDIIGDMKDIKKDTKGHWEGH